MGWFNKQYKKPEIKREMEEEKNASMTHKQKQNLTKL